MALALDGVPDFAAAPKGLKRACSGCQFRIAPSIEYQDRAFDDAKHGRPSRGPVFWGLFPTMADPSLAPPGRHILSANIFHAPNELREGSWKTERDRFGEHCIDILGEYLPGLKDRIIDRRFWSPADLEAEFGLPGANITHLDMPPRYMFGLRPAGGLLRLPLPDRGSLRLRLLYLARRHHHRRSGAQRQSASARGSVLGQRCALNPPNHPL